MEYGRAMKAWWEGRRRRGVAVIAIVAAALLAPATATALDSDLKGSAIFRLQASNGYSILVLAASERADGRGDLALIVHRGGDSAVYSAPATVTPTKLDADLGALGRISLDVVPSGREKTLRSRCGGEPVTYEPDFYRGSFEFHGEEGFSEARAERLPEYARFWLEFGCGGDSFGEATGAGRPGARLLVRRGKRHHRLRLQVNQNRPGARTVFEAEVTEKRGPIEIARTSSGRLASDAFRYDPLLRTATLAPPPPFSGHATFHRNAPPANRWSGNLTVDFPGRSNVPLTGPGLHADVVPARRQSLHRP
jgi:hypothetical protein